MHSIGREAEFARLNARAGEFREGHRRHLHVAVTAPPGGGLSLFLHDFAEHLRVHGDLVFDAELVDPHHMEALFGELNGFVRAAAGLPDGPRFGDLNSLFDSIEEFRRRRPGTVVFAVLDVAAALRVLDGNPAWRGEAAIRDPLLQRLRTLATWLSEREPPLGIILGWDDHFPSWAPRARAEDVVQRYAPSETLFADYGLGRAAWPHFRAIFDAAGVPAMADFPGICGGSMPAGAYVLKAKAQGLNRIDADFLLEVLLERAGGEVQERLRGVDRALLAQLCLQDTELQDEPTLGSLVQRSAEGGWIASRELYALLALTPPREVVSFADRVRQRLDDRDPELANELAAAAAGLIGQGAPVRTPLGWRVALKEALVPAPLRRVDATLLASLDPQLDSARMAAVASFVAEAERGPEGMRSLLVCLHTDRAFEAPLQRGIEAGLADLNIADARPYGAPRTETQGRPYAAVLPILLKREERKKYIIDLLDSTPDELVPVFRKEIFDHFKRVVLKGMPALTSEIFTGGVLTQLLLLAGQRRKLGARVGDALAQVGAIESCGGGNYRWRWSGDAVLEAIRDGGDATAMARKFVFDPEDWPAIGQAIQEAYTNTLVRWDGNRLEALNPAELLKQALREVEGEIAELLRQLSPNDRARSEARLGSDDNTPKDPAALDAILESRLVDLERLREEVNRYAEARRIREEEARRLAGEIEWADGAESAEREQLLQNADVEGLRAIRDRLRAVQAEQQQRERRLAAVESELTGLPAEGVERVRKLVAQRDVPPDQVIGQLEREKIAASATASTLTSIPPEARTGAKAEAKVTETFENTTEDLARLAEVFATRRILSVEVE